ncbi:hypothetical protein [Nonomuraea sp. LPB2021202275-12-8]|uniref:hypothetical protein n=1 Tax=Nonomuraea sp. LPB2021202275-12-8 TaxID=3120159 RepID=UPI00300C29F7
MLQRIRVAAVAAVALAMGAGALALTPSASAEVQVAAPTISKVRISPASPIVVFDKAVTATFTFSTKGATGAEFQLKAPGQQGVFTPVEVKAGPKNGDWTRWTATKSFDAAVAGTWNLLAIAKGDGEASTTGTFEVKKALTTKIVEFDANPDRVDKGDTIRVSGKLEADDKGYAGQKVTITFRARGTDAYRHVTSVTTGRNGWFAARVRAETTGWWRAEFAATAVARGSVSDTDRVSVKAGNRDSHISGFDAYREPVTKGDRLSFTGVLQAEGKHALPGQRVAITFKAHDSRHWQYVTSDVTNRDGRFWASTTAQASGWWRAEFRGAKGVNGSVSDADWVRVVEPTPPPEEEKADTRVISFNAYPEPVKRGKYLRFRGALQVDDEGVWEGYQGKVRLYFKPKGSDSYQYVKSTWSNSSGKLYTKVKAWNSGRWKFVYAGDEDTHGDASRTDYVRVKR